MIENTNMVADINILKNRLSAAYEYLVMKKDANNAVKVEELAQKLIKQEFAIAFCGHFSAGKSRMINCLIGDDLLPSSPIPTSANLVKIISGKTEYIKVYFKNSLPRLYEAPYDYQLVKKYCKDGDTIEQLEICHITSNIPTKTAILDTPGIDSADDAHRIATESAIHLADLIFYVMDYNHVQGELNFLFTKELSEAGKEVYLVINQVDKHLAHELSFEDFKNSVKESFGSWGVKPAGIFYTSLKETEHQYNQFDELKIFLHERLARRETLLIHSLNISLRKILNDHLMQQMAKIEAEQQVFRDILAKLPEVSCVKLRKDYEKIEADKAAVIRERDTAEKKFSDGLNKIMQNAYLMPFATRALAESYLASCEPSFRVGWLFRKQKTFAERQQRLNKFYDEINAKTKSQLEWHLVKFLNDFVKNNSLENNSVVQIIKNLSIDFTPELLQRSVKDGAQLSDAYVINYTDSVANEIKHIAQAQLLKITEVIMKELKTKNFALIQEYQQKSKELEKYLMALSEISKGKARQVVIESEITALVTMNRGIINDKFEIFIPKQESVEIIPAGHSITEKSALDAKADIGNLAASIDEQPVLGAMAGQLPLMAQKLHRTAVLINSLPGFTKISEELLEKSNRLSNKGFTVALFGAFSAGKSSFANALMGEMVLPVSPNPTTATINRIKPINKQKQHGCVVIQLKTYQVILADVNRALLVFNKKAAKLAEAIGIIANIIMPKEQGLKEKTNYTFLQAFKCGYEFFHDKLGERLNTNIAQFNEYVAKEAKSCFVEWIDLYYDCELTRQGITLVDTPGADSINSRHTGVAFEFIKNADAILFVTYYNHAFSKADREFLIQLGRVKDSFNLDKMFFVINAIDLAENKEEKLAVAEYVREHLIKYGVKNPHLYALSSLQALQVKQKSKLNYDNSDFKQFEEKFYNFIMHDLAQLAIIAAGTELKRIRRLVDELVINSQAAEDVKIAKRQSINEEKKNLQNLFIRENANYLLANMEQEIVELIYYIKQRVFLRFGDFFKESFNPAVLKDDGRDLSKALKNSLNELLNSVGFDFAQELRATTVRMDLFAQKSIGEYQERLAKESQQINLGLSYTPFEMRTDTVIEFKAAFEDIHWEMFGKALRLFKNPKTFFEKNESKIMNQAIYEILSREADQYLLNEQKRLIVYYTDFTKFQSAKLLKEMQEQADEFYVGLLAALAGGVSALELDNINDEFDKIISGNFTD